MSFEQLDADEAGMISVAELVSSIQRQARNSRFTDSEITAALEHAESENIIVVADDMVSFV